MSLAPGTRIGPYEIASVLGAGGMGEVYRARDTRLNRTVAIKSLQGAVAGDPERIARFEREAQLLASLNHPNIAAIHGLQEIVSSAGQPAATYLVLEFVDGNPLDAILRESGAMAVSDALPIAKQVADAIAAAHEKGIIHRDLKPGNVMVTGDGKVKVLDFGLGKSIENENTSAASQSNSPTMTLGGTQVGVILGTAGYMSPEQARGRPVDRRSDVWSFGCLLFEMIAGARAFEGEDVTETIAAIVRGEPNWKALPAATPPTLKNLIERCLIKDRSERLADMSVVRYVLNEPGVTGAVPAVTAHKKRSPIVPILGGALVVALIALGVTLVRPRATADAEPMHLTMTFPEGSTPQWGQPLPSMALSPDGRTFIYTAAGGPEGTQLWRRSLDDFTAKPIPGTGAGQASVGGSAPIARQAFFSPDGKSFGFVAGNIVKTMPITLGPATDVCHVFDGVSGATWTEQNEIVFAASAGKLGLWRVPAAGGTPVQVAAGEFYYPDALPGGRAVVVTSPNNQAERSSSDLTLVAVTLATGAVTKILDGGTNVRYVPTGHLVYGRDFALVATTFNSRTFAVGETRTPVVTDFWMDPTYASGNYALSASGTLVYAPGAPTDFERTLITIDGETTRPLLPDRRYFSSARMSPKGRYVAVMQRAWEDRVLIVDTLRGSSWRLTSAPHATEGTPVWSPDGVQVAFSAFLDVRGGIYIAPAHNNTGPPTMLYANDNIPTPTSFSRDGQNVVFDLRQPGTGYDLMMVSLGPEHTVKPLLQTNANERDGQVSPDNKTIAYTSSRTGRVEIWVSDFPSMQNAVQVSTEGGSNPVWAPNSRHLHFKRGPRVMTADVSRRSSGDIPRPTAGALFPVPYPTAFVDVMPDGKFLAIDGPRVGGGRELGVIVNWFSELKEKVR